MAGAPSDDATEDPTPKRLADARRRGDVPFSRELSSAVAFTAAAVVVTWGAPALVARWLDYARAALRTAVAGGAGAASLAAAPPGAASVAASAGAASSIAISMMAPALGAALVAAVAVGFAQTRGLLLVAPRFDLSRVASAAGWRKLFDLRAVATAGQGLLKVAVVGLVAWAVLRPLAGALVALTGASPARVLAALGDVAGRLAIRLAAAGLALGVLDYVLVARRQLRSLRMTREEIKREYKESEGDPETRGERRRLQRELSEQQMVEEVRKADFVVVNPEHIAVALRYDPNGDAAPVVVAKGQRLVAERIKQIAREAGVPIFRDVSLARSLVELAEGGEIPAALYEAVAEILRVVQGLDEPEPAPGGTGAGASPSPPPAMGPGAGWKRV
jgi:flagellar biosynthesis protein FlhB